MKARAPHDGTPRECAARAAHTGRHLSCGVSARFGAIATGVALGGCERVPSVNVLGAFFPSWMLCIVAGIALTLIGRSVLVATGLDPWIGPRAVVYPALALAFTLTTWLVFFRG